MRGTNIGRALGLLHRWMEGCALDEEFGHAMGAPMGELRHMIDRGRCKDLRHLRRRIKGMTGLKWRVFLKEVERRTSARWTHFHSPLGYVMQYYSMGPIRPSWVGRGY